ncbi:phage integrase N-terminal SAM-like domain-containing protein [Pseudoalteromonas piscicida]|uniref:phage integrase N-terminal SAM-like domain-containing protein n=1 Tax=Pseudoalteromonas piscicida TaxID=43662 RepID=UPI0030951D94
MAGFVNYHDKRHPTPMGDNEVQKYLEYLALKKNVSPKTQATTWSSVSERLLWGNGALVKY